MLLSPHMRFSTRVLDVFIFVSFFLHVRVTVTPEQEHPSLPPCSYGGRLIATSLMARSTCFLFVQVNREEGGDTDGGGEARVEEREAGGAGRHGGRAAGVPARRRHPHGVREEAPGVQAGGRRPGAQGGGAAGGRAHRLVLLVPPPRRQEGELLVPGRGRPPRLREGDRRRGHAGPRAEGRARRPEGQVGRRLPQGAHPRAARRPRRDPQRVLLIHRPQFQAYQVFLAVSVC
uniref:Uncharacterized protein n=1 Tax=Zea mays TaxID=4577 RepID=B4FP38_MAIZE|nr:unknown [Zea mays]